MPVFPPRGPETEDTDAALGITVALVFSLAIWGLAIAYVVCCRCC
jgi:hypothetical protein